MKLLAFLLLLFSNEASSLNLTIGTFRPIIEDKTEKFFERDVLLKQIGQTLVESTPNGSLASGLASKWTISKDRLVYSFELKDKVFYHNNIKLNSQLVIKELNNLIYEKDGVLSSILSPYLYKYQEGLKSKKCECFKVLSPRKLKIRLEKPFTPLIKILSSSNSILLYPSPKGANKNIGTGPYKITSENKDSYFIEKHEKYNGLYEAKIPSFELKKSDIHKDFYKIFLKNIIKKEVDYTFTPHISIAEKSEEHGYKVRKLPMFAKVAFYFNAKLYEEVNNDKRKKIFNILSSVIPMNMGHLGMNRLNDVYSKGMQAYSSHNINIDLPLKKTNIKIIRIATLSKQLYGLKKIIKENFNTKNIKVEIIDLSGNYIESFSDASIDVFMIGNAAPYLDPHASLIILEYILNSQSNQETTLISKMVSEAASYPAGRERISKYQDISNFLLSNKYVLPVAQFNLNEIYKPDKIKLETTKFRYSPMFSNLEYSK